MSDTLDLTTVSDEPVESNVQVEITDADPDAEGTVEEPVPDAEEPEETVEESVEEESPVEEESVEEAPVETESSVKAPVEEAPEEVAEPVETEESVSVETPEEASSAPVEQVATDIRNILTEVPTVSSELSDDLKQRIVELDYLSQICSEWVDMSRGGPYHFLNTWSNKSVTVDPTIDYENVLVKLGKLPEIIRLWGQGKVRPNSNHFKNLDGYTLTKSLFNNKSLVEKVEVLEQLVGLLTDCANRKMNTKQITDYIDNLY